MRTYGSKTERERQANVAKMLGRGIWYTYKCADGQLFKALAMTEPGAFRVLKEERPGIAADLVSAELDS